MRLDLLACTLVFTACVAESSPPGSQTEDPASSTPTSDPGTTPNASDPSDPSAPQPDEELVRRLISGDLSPDEVMPAVAWRGGWPVATAGGTFLFVHRDPRGGWALAGDFNGWDPEPMNQGEGFWWAEVTIDDPTGQRYKFVDGGATWRADPFARSYTYDEFGEIGFVAPDPDTWRIDRWPGLEGEGLGPRDLRVYVPAGQGPWPVLYLHDGQNLFDPDAIWGGWRIQEAMVGLEPALLVGIDNAGLARLDEYTHVEDDIGYGAPMGGLGDAYAALLEAHVRPHVESVYGTTGHDGVMGSSLGGLISLYIAHRYPGAFDFAGSLSGTLGWGAYADSGPTMEALYLAAGHRGTALYLDSGGSPGGDGACTDGDGDGAFEDDRDDSDNYCVTRDFADSMAAQGYTWNEDLWHWHEPGAGHNEMEWAARVEVPLSLFLSLQD